MEKHNEALRDRCFKVNQILHGLEAWFDADCYVKREAQAHGQHIMLSSEGVNKIQHSARGYMVFVT